VKTARGAVPLWEIVCSRSEPAAASAERQSRLVPRPGREWWVSPRAPQVVDGPMAVLMSGGRTVSASIRAEMSCGLACSEESVDGDVTPGASGRHSLMTSSADQ
jgi:hypothetical protein